MAKSRGFYIFFVGWLLLAVPCFSQVKSKEAFYKFLYKGDKTREEMGNLARAYETLSDIRERSKQQFLLYDSASIEELDLAGFIDGTASILKIAHFPSMKCLHYLYVSSAGVDEERVIGIQNRMQALHKKQETLELLLHILPRVDEILRMGVFPYYGNEVAPEEDFQVIDALQNFFESHRRIPEFAARRLFKRKKPASTMPKQVLKSNFDTHLLRITAVEFELYSALSLIYLQWQRILAPAKDWLLAWAKYLWNRQSCPDLYPLYITGKADSNAAGHQQGYFYAATKWLMSKLDDGLNLLLNQQQTYFANVYDALLGPYIVGGLGYTFWAMSQTILEPIRVVENIWAYTTRMLSIYQLLVQATNYLTVLLHNIADAASMLKRVAKIIEKNPELQEEFALYLQPINKFLTHKKTAYLRELLDDIHALSRKEATIWDIIWPWSSWASDRLAYYRLLRTEVTEEEHMVFRKGIYALGCILLETAYAKQFSKSQGAHNTEAPIALAKFVKGARPTIKGTQLYIPLDKRALSTKNDIDFQEPKIIIQGANGSGKKTYSKIAACNVVLAQATGWVLGEQAELIMADELLYISGLQERAASIEKMTQAICAAKSNKKCLIFCHAPFQSTCPAEGSEVTIASLEEMTNKTNATVVISSYFLDIATTIRQWNFTGYHFITVEEFVGRPGYTRAPIFFPFAQAHGLPPSVLKTAKKMFKKRRGY